MAGPSTSGTPEFDLDRAYSVETPEDNRQLYADWAATYDRGFLATHGYVYHESVVAAFHRRGRPTGPVLDVGCGTGVVGEELVRRGEPIVDGIDLSPEMLTVAATKRSSGDAPLYRSLIEADLTGTVAIESETYAGVVSAGAFTHGHLGPEPLDELVRIAMPNAVFAIGINADFFISAGFGSWFDAAVAGGVIGDLEIIRSPVYDPDRYEADDADDHATTESSVALFVRSRPS